MKGQPATVVTLSASQRAIITPTGVYLIRGRDVWWLDTREFEKLKAAV